MSKTSASVIEGMLWPLKLGETLSNHDWFTFFGHRFLRSGFLSDVILDDRRADLGTALILWTEAIYSDPAGTLPTCDRKLATLARFPSVEAWLACKEGVMHGWALVDVEDDRTGETHKRFGHAMTLKVVDEMATRAKARTAARTAGADRKKAERIRKKLKGLNLPKHVWDNEELVQRLVRHFNLADLFVTDGNLRDALVHVIGYTGEIVPFAGKQDQGRSRG